MKAPVSELEALFSTAQLPREIQLDHASRITDVKLFVESHLAVLKQNEGRAAYDGFYDRLEKAKKIIEGHGAQGEAAV